MKKLILPALAASALLLGACSTTQLAQQSNAEDDVYFTKAKAREVPNPVVSTENTQNTQNTRNERTYRTDEQLYGGGNYTDEYYSDYNYDYGYASRLNRFYDRSPWRSGYYDPWYSYSYMPWYTYRYDPFFYDPWYYSPGTSVWIGVGVYPRYGWYDNYYWGFYGSPYSSRYWGPYSYYNVYPGYYGGGYYGGGYYGGVNQLPNRRRPNYTDPNYRSRPGSGSDGYTRAPRTVGTDGQGRVMNGGSRGERWGNANSRPAPSSETSGRNSGRTSSTAPSRTERSSNEGSGSSRAARPERVEQSRPSRETYSPPASSGPSRSSGGSSSGGGGGSSRSSRPSRAGGN